MRQAVEHIQAFLAAVDQGRVPQCLEMLRRVGEGQPHLRRKGINRSLALGEQLEQLEAVWAGQGFPDSGELTVQAVFELSMRRHTQVINTLLE
jgi:hypothetical protein